MAFWKSEVVLAKLPHGEGDDTIQVRKCVGKNGSVFVDVRQFFVGDDGQERPTRKGICIAEKNVAGVAQILSTFLAESEGVAKG